MSFIDISRSIIKLLNVPLFKILVAWKDNNQLSECTYIRNTSTV